MARNNHPDDTVKVKDLPTHKGVYTGKPRKITTSSGMSKVAFASAGNTIGGSGGNFYSPELSTDFLKLPQSIDERRNFYRFFYDHHPYIGQAIDLLVDLPLSKVRLAMPVAQNRELAEKAMRFCDRWSDKVHLLERLMQMSHEYHCLGEAIIFCEDRSPEMPRDVREQLIREITEEGEATEKWETYPDADDREVAWLKKNYFGWTSVRCLNPDGIHIESFQWTDEILIEVIPDSKTKAIINKADSGDLQAIRIVNSMPQEIVQAVREGVTLPMNTDPDAGSFVYVMARKRSQYAERGQSVLQRCLLPGTPIWVKRDGILQQIAVENVNDQTDLLLTHKGRFCPCKAGSRLVSEEITVLNVEGIKDPLKLTSDHLVLRIQDDGTEEWIKAGNLQKGDLVRESHVIPEKTPMKKVNLVDWWKGRSLQGVKRGLDKETKKQTFVPRTIHVTNANLSDMSELVVDFSYDAEDKNRASAIPKMEKLLQWARGLTEPVVKNRAEVAVLAGLSERDVRVYLRRLRDRGVLKAETKSLGWPKGKQITWFPCIKELPVMTTFQLSSPTTKLNITKDFCYLLGSWLGDGCVWMDDTKIGVAGIGWALNDKEPEIRDYILSMIATCLPKAVVIHGCLRGGVEEDDAHSIHIDDPLLACWFKEEFGHTAQGKRLPAWIFDLPDAFLLALLRGVLDTDGCLVESKYPSIRVTLDNKLLIDQLHLICNKVGIKTQAGPKIITGKDWPHEWQTKTGRKKKTYTYKTKTYWRLACSLSKDIRLWAKNSVKGDRMVWPTTKDIGRPAFVNDYLSRAIVDSTRTQYSGPVFSFDVLGDESHVTGSIVTHNCMRALVFQDQVRQSMSSICDRHMTPLRLIYFEDSNPEQLDMVREQVDLALQDPDYSIITNFELHWEEMGAEQRLPDWSWVWELTDKQLYAGLGVTESLLTGESSYSGDRIHLEVINVRFLLLREMFQRVVEEYFFKPMCRRMGFVEEDEDGVLQVITPRLSFTRLALRDTQETYDALLNLYTKGSLDIDVILELLNIDPVTTAAKLKRDIMTQNDALYNEFQRALYGAVGSAAVDQSDVVQKMVEGMGLKFKAKDDGGNRF